MVDNQDFKNKGTANDSARRRQIRGIVTNLKQKPMLIAGVIGLVLLLGMILLGSSQPQRHELAVNPVSFEANSEDMIGVKESVDPRDVWTARVEQKVSEQSADLRKNLEELDNKKKEELSKLQEEIGELKETMKKQQELMEQRALEESMLRSNSVSINQPTPVWKKARSLGLFSKDYGGGVKNGKNYVAAGTFARAVLTMGVVAGTGSKTQSNPEPIEVRLTDAGIFSKFSKVEELKDALLLGECEGNLAQERAKCRLHTLSLENHKGEKIEKQVEAWIVGEDGRYGIKGEVVDKSSDMLRLAILNGILGGFSKFLQNQSTQGIFPISPIAGQQNALGAVAQLKGGAASGAGEAFSKTADFLMERFTSMSPEIMVDSGREVDVLFKKGFDITGNFNEGFEQTIQVSDGNLMRGKQVATTRSEPVLNQKTQADAYAAFSKSLQQMNNDKGQGQQRDAF